MVFDQDADDENDLPPLPDVHTVHDWPHPAATLRDLLVANTRELKLISKQLHQLKEKVQTMSDQQAHLDSDVDQLRSEIKTELDAVKAANPSVDLSKLDKLVAENAPTAPSPAPAPAPAPVEPGTATPPATGNPASTPPA